MVPIHIVCAVGTPSAVSVQSCLLCNIVCLPCVCYAQALIIDEIEIVGSGKGKKKKEVKVLPKWQVRGKIQTEK